MQPGLEALEEVIVPPEKDGLPVIRCGDIYGDTPFFYLQSLKTLAFPESVTVLKESLFGYVGVERLYVPNTVTTIEKWVFCNCKNLKELYIPDSVTSLAEDTFSDCPSLKSLRLPAGLGIVPSYSGTGLEAIAVEEGIEEIPDYAFSDTACLKTLTLPSTLKKIGFRILEHSSLASLDLPDGVEELSDQAFNVASLTKIFLPASVATVGRMAFCNLPDEFELYCEAESRPEGWDEEFMYKNELGGYEWKIHWGAKRSDLA